MAEQVTNRTMTFGEMKTTVRFLLADGDIIFPLEQIQMALNMGLQTVHHQSHREQLDIYTNTIANQREYVIPDVRFDAGSVIIDGVWIGDTQIGNTLYSQPAEDEEAGEPTSYAMLGNTMYLYPIPDDVYELHVLARNEFNPLSADLDEAPLGDIEIQAAIMYACYLLKIKDEQFESAQAFLQAYNQALANALTHPAGVYSANYQRLM